MSETAAPSAGELTAIVMAKLPRPGAVKRRLATEQGGFTAESAARIAEAMLRCIVRRLAARWPVVVAVSPDDAVAAMRELLGDDRLAFQPQGAGELGERMDRLWRQFPERPVAYFGCDSPDIPGDILDRLLIELRAHDAVIGPTDDGGYWTLAASQYRPALLHEIDWGTSIVYDQTIARARNAGLACCELPTWLDVDHPHDVAALVNRLRTRHDSRTSYPVGTNDGDTAVAHDQSGSSRATRTVTDSAGVNGETIRREDEAAFFRLESQLAELLVADRVE